jgi:carboxylate-amine ligase
VSAPDEQALRAAFDAPAPLTVGLEEEVLLLDPDTFALAPVALEVVRRAGSDPRIKLELPAAQVELLTRPHARVEGALDELAGGRQALLDACRDLARPAAGAVHPNAPAEVQLNAGERYSAIEDTYGLVARRQLVGALQVHVALGDADRTLAVYNALRGLLPEIAALAAAAPFHEDRDTGLASIRPLIGGQLPRQGVPPAIESWAAFAADLAWGRAAGTVAEPRRWWWELRPHVVHGTLELRVPDVQPTLDDAEGVVAFAHGLVRWLAARHDDGEDLGSPPTWRIAENRWSALRHGVEGDLADLVTGRREPTRARLLHLIAELEAAFGQPLDRSRNLVERNAAMWLRGVGLRRAAPCLADAFPG